MKLTPQEITNQEFSTKMRGFDKDEVKDFLLQIAGAIESEILEKEELKKELENQKGTLSKLRKKEELLRETLISAQKFSHDIKHSAERESDIIVKEAEIKADEILNDAMSRQKTLREEIRHLQYKRKEIESDLINTLNSLKELIESYQKEDEAFDKVEYLKK